MLILKKYTLNGNHLQTVVNYTFFCIKLNHIYSRYVFSHGLDNLGPTKIYHSIFSAAENVETRNICNQQKYISIHNNVKQNITKKNKSSF